MRRDRYSPREPFRAKANNNKTTPGVKVTTGTDYAKEIALTQTCPESLK